MISVAVDKRSRQVQIDIETHHRIMPIKLRQALHEIGSDVKRETRRLIKDTNKTGRIYQFNGRPHQASAPGEAPANRTGKLSKSVNYKVRNEQEMGVGESELYAVFLENGTKKIAPRPHLIRAINQRAGATYTTLEAVVRNL